MDPWNQWTNDESNEYLKNQIRDMRIWIRQETDILYFKGIVLTKIILLFGYSRISVNLSENVKIWLSIKNINLSKPHENHKNCLYNS